MAFTTLLTGLLALSTSASSLSILPRSITPPEGCPLPTWKVDEFKWYNGSSSLDCFRGPRTEEGCLCTIDGKSSWCDPNPETCNGTMVNVCYTGLPNYAPWGHGPPQTLDIKFEDGLTCHDEYAGFRPHDIAHGESNCGYADRSLGRIVAFYGSSNEATSTGHMDYTLGSGHALKCANGSSITYSGSTDFQLSCTHDESFNATCTAPAFEIPITSFSWVL